MSLLRENENYIAICKLKHNLAIRLTDISERERILFESGEVVIMEVFEQAYGKQVNLGLFIRAMIGLDSEYLDGQTFSANQIRFVNVVIEYLIQNGVMDAGKLYESPFTHFSAESVDGIFQDRELNKIISILAMIRGNAAA